MYNLQSVNIEDDEGKEGEKNAFFSSQCSAY